MTKQKMIEMLKILFGNLNTKGGILKKTDIDVACNWNVILIK